MKTYCDMPHCPHKGEKVWTEVFNIGDETGLVLRNICADCLDPEP